MRWSVRFRRLDRGSGEAAFAKAANGRRPVGLEIMLLTYFVHQWFNLSYPGAVEALD